MELNKGQSFTMSAVILSATMIIIAVNVNFGSFHTEGTTKQDYFSQKLDQKPSVFNQAIRNNYSNKNIKKDVYTYNRFIERDSRSRGLDYKALNFYILPEKGEYSVINYHNNSTEFSIMIDEVNENLTIEAFQWYEGDFEPGLKEVNVEFTEEGINESFNASTPRSVNFMKMESEQEKWVNHVVN